MSRNEIKLQFASADAVVRGFPLEDFLRQLDAVKKALSFADRIANSMEHDSFTYEISGMSMNSPAMVSLEPVSSRNDGRQAIFNPEPMFSAVWKLCAREKLDAFEIRCFEGLRPIAEALRLSPSSSIGIQYADEKIDVPGNLEFLIDEYEKHGTIETISAADHSGFYEMYARQEIWELGSVIGRLEAVDFHQDKCGIYTPFSSRPVTCEFPESLTDVIHGNLRRKVEAFGKIHTPAGKPLPDKMEIHSIEVIAEEPSRSLRSMQGILL